MIRHLAILLAAGIIVALPFIFRQADQQTDWRPGDPVLTIITPHSAAIRYEFAQAFSAWHKQKYGRPVKIDWLNIGGTTEISRYLVSQFEAALRATGATNAVSVGVDLFFGGGEYDHQQAFRHGLTVPPWPDGQEPRNLLAAIPKTMGGETWRTSTLFGTALSTFGICYNRDRLRDLGVAAPPTQWIDLTAPVYFGQLGVADPTKSGSIAKAFEMIVQQQICETVRAAGFTDEQIDEYEACGHGPTAYEAAIARGWENGLHVVQLIGANARYFTDSAGKVPIDVGAGDAAAGLAIDFYARFEAEVAGGHRMVYVTPRGGSSVSCDPISLLRGAPHRQLAVRFIEFVLSADGQRLWNDRPGLSCSRVKKYALQRLPIRRDFYPPHPYPQSCSTDDLADPAIDPYVLAAAFTYRPRWTAGHFNVHRDLIRAMCLDAGPELHTAWAAIIAHGGPARQPEPMAWLQRLPDRPEPLTWQSARAITKKYDRLDYLRDWTECFRENYRQARERVMR